MLGFLGEIEPIARNDLIEMLAEMNYSSVTGRGKLVGALQERVVPWLPVVGDANGEIYRIPPRSIRTAARPTRAQV